MGTSKLLGQPNKMSRVNSAQHSQSLHALAVKLNSFSFLGTNRDNNVILKLENGKDLTTETFETHGFNRPMLIVNKEGLGMVIPDKRFTVMDVERHVGMYMYACGSLNNFF